MTSAIVERSPLARIAKLIESVAKANHPVSTCQNVRVKIADNRIELFANDLDKSLRMWVPAETPKPGTSFLVPAARLSSFLNGAVGSDAKLSWTKAALTVNIGAARSVLQTLPASDLPELEGDAGEGAALSADLLRTVC
jgi:DNA polymerase III sliding clamp (beta) subunit (PCNA family)